MKVNETEPLSMVGVIFKINPATFLIIEFYSLQQLVVNESKHAVKYIFVVHNPSSDHETFKTG